MLKVLLKKQLAEFFKGYFYNAKKNRARSRAGIIGWFAFYAVIMVGILGGAFTALSILLCKPLVAVSVDWLYFLIMGMAALVLGLFGSVFSTYQGVYLSEDNDLLLSMPIPVSTILASRLLGVYLMGALYTVVVFLPAVIVYWAVAPVTVGGIVGPIVMLLLLTLLVLALSCLLGWAVAAISRRLKNKSFVTVFASLLGIGLYYFLYFKAQTLLQEIVRNAAFYGKKLEGSAAMLASFGKLGTGNLTAMGLWTAGTVVFLVLVWKLLSKSFLSIAASGGKQRKKEYRENTAKEKSPFWAVLRKELGRFTASPNYMLNCGLGMVFLITVGIMALWKGKEFYGRISAALPGHEGAAAVILCAILGAITSMNDMAAPSVSLEGKNLWILQSLPVSGKTVLRAKLSLQLLLTSIPALFCGVCVAGVLNGTALTSCLIVIFVLCYNAFMAAFGLFLGVKLPNLTWTNEVVPVKQSACVAITLFGGWAFCAAMALLYLWQAWHIGATVYLAIVTVFVLAATGTLIRWLDTRGSRIFATL